MFSLRAAEALATFLLLDSDGLDDIFVDELDRLHNDMRKEEVDRYLAKSALSKSKRDSSLRKIVNLRPENPPKRRRQNEEPHQKKIPLDFIDNYKIDFGLSATQIERLTQIIGSVYKKSHLEKNLKVFVLIGLCSITTNMSYSEIGEKFSKNKHMICLCSQQFNKLLAENFNDYIRWPKGKEAEVAKDFESICGFPNVIGAFGTCYLPLKSSFDKNSPQEGEEENCVVLAATTDPTMRFTSLSIDSPSNFQTTNGMSSQTIQTLLREPQNLINKDMHILAGGGFPLCDHILTPYLGNTLTDDQDMFNAKLETTRRVVFKAFNYLCQHFQRLPLMDTTNFSNCASSVVASCILHNFLLDDEEDKSVSDNPLLDSKDVLECDNQDDVVSLKRDEMAKKFLLESSEIKRPIIVSHTFVQ